MEKTKYLKKLCVVIAAELFLAALIVWFFDPFYQYHAPLAGMKAVLNDRDNQMSGTIRNFSYDSVLVGSSVAENFDSGYVDEIYGCRTLKVIRASGSIADLLYYMEMAQKNQELRNVFWCLDLFALSSSTDVTLLSGDTPRYLHTKEVFDDIPYLFNKEILLEKIPYMLVAAHLEINTDGNAYNWASNKVFSAAQAMRAYDRSGVGETGEIEQKDFTERKELIEDNIALLTGQVAAHPDITYRFLFPPYSMLWWDCAYVNGELSERLYVLEEALSALTEFDNTEIYFFQAEEEIVCDLDNYMDMIHYSPEINQIMLGKMAAGENRVGRENIGETMEKIRALTERISREDILSYYPCEQ